jgi:hypothetical protein
VREFLQDQPEVAAIHDAGQDYYPHHAPTEEQKTARHKVKRSKEEHAADLAKEKQRVDGLIRKARKINRAREQKEAVLKAAGVASDVPTSSGESAELLPKKGTVGDSAGKKKKKKSFGNVAKGPDKGEL